MLRKTRKAFHSSRIFDKASSDTHDAIRMCNENLNQISRMGSISTPSYDRREVRPGVVNIGLRNFHRVHNAVFFDSLLHFPGNSSWGMATVSVTEMQRKVLDELKIQNNLYTVVEKRGDGNSNLRVIGSIVESLRQPEDSKPIVDLISSNETRMVTLTLRETNYFFNQEFTKLDISNPNIQHDLTAGKHSNKAPRTGAGLLVAGLYQRYLNKGHPLTVLSCDNLSRNGEISRIMVESFAVNKYPLNTGFHRWLSESVFYPNTMCDRICLTDPSEDRIGLQQDLGVRDNALLTTETHNEWIIEKWMGNKPEGLEEVGIKMVPCTLPYENIKVRLNYGCRLAVATVASSIGIRSFEDALSDDHISLFVDAFMREASLGLGNVPKDLNLDEYMKSVKKRIATPHLKYLTAKVLEDASKKMMMDWKPVLQDLPTGTTPPTIAFAFSSWIHMLAGSSYVSEEHGYITITDANKPALEILAKNVIGCVGTSNESSSVNDLLKVSFGLDAEFIVPLQAEMSKSLRNIEQHGIRGALRILVS